MIRRAARFGAALAAIFLCLHIAHLGAQTVTGTILGTVQDSQGAVVPKAEVSARNVETGQTRAGSTDVYGNYRISSVPAGSYEISVTASGFRTEVRKGVTVTVGADVVVNFALSVGTVAEHVEVTGQAPQVDTSTATMGGLVNSASIRELPLNGRDWLQLAILQPGATFESAQDQGDANRTQRGFGLAITISGGRPTDNAFRIDGLIVNDYANAGPGSALRVNMGVDAIREFSVLTNSYSAEYGRGSGGIVNAITKSGTNGLHGSAYYFVRNSALDARNFFDLDLPPFRRHQFGGAAGGPIRKDKTFFFANYEGLREFKSLSFFSDTLSPNARTGVICAGATADNPCPRTTTVTPNRNVVPYLALYPRPNGPITGDTGKFIFGGGRVGGEDFVIGKIDHNFSANTALSGSYSYDNASVAVPDDYDLKLVTSPSRRQNVTLNLQHIFSATLISNTRAGVSRTYAAGNIDHSPASPLLTDPSLGFVPGRNVGQFSVGGLANSWSGIGAGLGGNGLKIYAYTAPQVYQDLSRSAGRNSIRAGFSVERITFNNNSADTPNGRWSFTSIANMLQGISNQFNSDFPGTDTIRGERSTIVAGYVQDDFRFRSNLTLNLGLRYEMATVITEVNGKVANLRHYADTDPTVGDPYYENPTLRNFAPRLGFAWDPFKNGKTAVRGGFGLFDIVPLPYLFANRMPRSNPFYIAGFINSPPVSSFPSGVFQLLGKTNVRTAHIEFNPHRAYKAQWNMNIQRQLTKDLALTVGYVGASGVHLARSIEDADQVPPTLVSFTNGHYTFPTTGTIQRINPNFGRIATTEWSGHSSYHALQTNLTERLSHGLMFQIVYTWSKSIDNGSNTFSDNETPNNAGAPWAFDPRLNRGVSDFDTPHNFVANFQWDVPLGRSSKGASHLLLGGWQLGGILTLQSGGPFTLKITSDRARTGSSVVTGSTGAQRPDFNAISGCSPDAVTGAIDHYVKTQCFSFPALGTLGNLGRNTLRVPAFKDFDFSVFKNHDLFGERLRIQFRAETFNLLNHPNFQASTRSIFSPSPGQPAVDPGVLIPTVGQQRSPTVNSSRQIQFGLKFIF